MPHFRTQDSSVFRIQIYGDCVDLVTLEMDREHKQMNISLIITQLTNALIVCHLF